VSPLLELVTVLLLEWLFPAVKSKLL
jgi:hypothetical protein